MLKNTGVVLVCLCVLGCAGFTQLFVSNSKEKIARINRLRLTQLKVGMSKDQVLKIMGKETFLQNFEGYNYIENPYKTEIIEPRKGVSYEVIYYFTYAEDDYHWGNTQRGLDLYKECTPLIFKDNLLIDWGNVALKELTGRVSKSYENLY